MKQTRSFNVYLAILATGILTFSGVLIETAMNVTFPTLIKQFTISTVQVQWVTTIYLLMISIIVPLSSFLTKNYSMRKLFTSAIILFILGVAINCIPISFSLLLLGRVFQGIATGIALPLMFSIILTKVPIKNRGMMIGVGTLTTSIAPALGPTYGGLLTSTRGWSYIYIFLLPILAAAALVGFYAIPEEPVKKTEQLNLSAAFALAVMFSSLLLSFNYVKHPVFWLILTIGIGSAFVFYECNKKQPLLNLSVFTNQAFRRCLFGFLVFQAMLLGVSFIIPNFMQIVFEVPASQAGGMMFPGALVGAVFAPISGKILDQLGAKRPVLIGLLLSLIGWGLLSILLTGGIIPLIIACHVLFMVGLGLAYSNLMTVGLSATSSDKQSDGNAIFSTLQQFIGAVSTAFAALIMNLSQKSASDLAKGTSAGAKLTLLCLFGLLLLSFVVLFIQLVIQPKRAV
ncbi:MFS transporter [Enterococcus sp. BWR-S5]|uniref:MFS transporter n=1 Tax=Enterococcus sp. BWR-S5 TaxID=2787714 RepID=UPI0019238184|nr:MFS transporter [Enterococcus sp. BWR-S5]MBL1224069.1 MFS transporter [Enterococcus sp. BWR-S5]